MTAALISNYRIVFAQDKDLLTPFFAVVRFDYSAQFTGVDLVVRVHCLNKSVTFSTETFETPNCKTSPPVSNRTHNNVLSLNTAIVQLKFV